MPTPYYDHAGITIYHGDCRHVMMALNENSVDSIVTDPPYGLTQNKKGGSGEASLNLGSPAGRSRVTTGGGFMGQQWDATTPHADIWREAIRVAKPGAYLLAFGGTRTFHRLVCAIEDAGWEIRDCVMWVYGSGFPKSLDVSKAIDKAAGAERRIVGRKTGRGASPVSDMRGGRMHAGGTKAGAMDCSAITAPATDEAQQWEGWGTALKPAWEPIVVARKPLIGTVAANVLEYGIGAMNIDGGRVTTGDDLNGGAYSGDKRSRDEYTSTDTTDGSVPMSRLNRGIGEYAAPSGRWPANLIHDGSEEVVDLFPQSSGSSAARFFYCAKASKSDRGEGNNHPTVKPDALMRYLCNLVTPPGGVVLDPFMGSGSTGKAAHADGFCFIGIEAERDYCKIAVKRLGRGVLFPTKVIDARGHK